MKSEIKRTIALFGGATLVAFAAGFGGATTGAIAMAPTTPVAAATQATPLAVAPAAPAANQPTAEGVVHAETLTGCIGGLNC